MPKWMQNTNNQVATMVKEKQELEVDLGKKILEAFNKPALLDPLRMLVAWSAMEMVKQDQPVKAGVAEAIADETKANNAFVKNAEFVKAVAGQPNKLLTTVLNSFSATDCSNVIRLYGAFIEKYNAKQKGEKDSLRLDFKKRERWRDPAQLDELNKALEKAKGSSPVMKAAIAKYESEGMSEYYAVQHALVSMNGGQAQWRLEFDSRILKLDTWFGLVGASDISGTTTDTLYFLNHAHGTAELTDPLYRLLPVGTIVSGAHHSLIEVALPLSQNNLCDYAIGKYTSLMVNGTAHPAKGDIQGILTQFENDKRNHLMVVGYTGDFKAIVEIEKAKKEDAKKAPNDPTRVTAASKCVAYTAALKNIKVDGAYVFEPGEKGAFFAMANAKKLHVAMDKEHAWPTHSNLRAWLQKNGFPKTE